MKGIAKCIKCGKEFKWKRGTEQYEKSGIPKWCSTGCRRTIFEKNFDFDGNRNGKSKCNACEEIFIWKRSQSQLEKRGKPNYCSRSCQATVQCREKLFYLDDLTYNEKIERLKKSFEKKVIKKEGCWEWKGSSQGTGYYQIRFNKHYIMAHRASWIIHKGEIPNRICVCHKCDNRQCTNPEHLFLGTHKDNMEDRTKKGRGQRGITHNKCKLSENDVREIRKRLKLGENITMIAACFNVSEGTIWHIREGITWKHLI